MISLFDTKISFYSNVEDNVEKESKAIATPLPKWFFASSCS